MSLVHSSYIVAPGRVVGTPLLVSTLNPFSITKASPVTVLNESGSTLSADPYDFNSKYPLQLKLFFYNITLVGTVAYPNPQYIVNVSGPAFEDTFKIDRYDGNNFGFSHYLNGWNIETLSVTVSLSVIPPLTDVQLTCFAGLATDDNGQDRSKF